MTSEEWQGLQRAAEQGDANAQYLLGFWYFSGQGGQKDYTKAAEWFGKAAAQGDALSQYYTGLLYFVGHGVAEDYTKAAEWFGKAAEQGNDRAQFYMGLLYKSGGGVPQDSAKAAEWFAKAAEQGDEDAKSELSKMLGPYVPMEVIEAMHKVAAQGNREVASTIRLSGQVACVHGLKSLGTEQYADAVHYFSHAAALGNENAPYYLGKMFLDGQGVPRDNAKADELIRKAAERGCKEAKDYLAKAEAKEKAAKLRKPAEQGDVEAQRELGLYYYQEYSWSSAAAEWLGKAAEQGDAVAQFKLGLMYFKKDGIIPGNITKAAKLFKKAAAQGNKEAQDYLVKANKIKRNTIIRCIVGAIVGFLVGLTYLEFGIDFAIVSAFLSAALCIISAYLIGKWCSGIGGGIGYGILFGVIGYAIFSPIMLKIAGDSTKMHLGLALVAGLLFGGPSGLIIGIFSGIFRHNAVS